MPKPKSTEKTANQQEKNSTAEGATFEDAMTDLQEIVSNLEDNSLGLEASLAQFERGIGLLRQCHQFLEQAEQKIEILLSFKPNGEAATAAFDATPTAGGTDSKTLF